MYYLLHLLRLNANRPRARACVCVWVYVVCMRVCVCVRVCVSDLLKIKGNRLLRQPFTAVENTSSSPDGLARTLRYLCERFLNKKNVVCISFEWKQTVRVLRALAAVCTTFVASVYTRIGRYTSEVRRTDVIILICRGAARNLS